ncbi:MAG: hypothetical protein P1U34_08060 [Coxiellaceae bacterium]|nr:hypothetical protein [Coxiellaceae bacterium]
MLKYCLILILCSSTCWASSSYFHNDFYVAGNVLMLIPANKLELTNAGAAAPFSTRYDHGNKIGISALGGYQWLFNNAYVAAQFGVRTIFGRTTGTLLDGNINTPQVSLPVTFSFAAKPGLVIKQSALLYGLFGGVVSKISMNQSYDTIPLSINQWQAGLLLGLGVDVPLSQRCAVGLLYQYEWYPAVNQFASNIRNNFNDTLFPRAQTIAVTLSWLLQA